MSKPNIRLAWWAFGLLAFLLSWDASGLDLALAHEFGGGQGFALRDAWVLTHVLHDGAKYVAWLLLLLLSLCVTWPVGPLARLPFRRRLQLPVSALLASAIVTMLKSASGASCPWDLAEFGGVARYISHWSGWFGTDGGAGRCFPAGHAATGFAFVGGYFALRDDQPALARGWLAGAIVAGFILGGAQQLRGAHFLSHTLWTGWICWIVGWMVNEVFERARRDRKFVE